MENTVKNQKVIKMKNRAKTKQKTTGRIVEGKNSVVLVETMDRKQSMAEKKLSLEQKSGQATKLKQKKEEIDVPVDFTDLAKLNKKIKSRKISDNLSELDNVKKRKISLAENTDHTNVNQEPSKKKKKKKSEKCDESEFESGHKVVVEKSNKHLSASASDGLPSDVCEENKTKYKSLDVKKAKKNKQKEENIPAQAKEDNSEEGTCHVVPKKKDKKKKKKDVKDKQDGSEDASISAQTAAINYLKTWSDDNINWKFQKVRQVWLLQHMYDESEVPTTDFDRLLLYLENLKGKAKEATLAKASKIIEAEDRSSDEDINEDEKTARARQVMQMLN